MLADGESPARIPGRLGSSAVALTRYLYRHDRPDLARRFSNEDWRERTNRARSRA